MIMSDRTLAQIHALGLKSSFLITLKPICSAAQINAPLEGLLKPHVVQKLRSYQNMLIQ